MRKALKFNLNLILRIVSGSPRVSFSLALEQLLLN